MPKRAIRCINCGMEGELQARGINNDVARSMVFRYRGHNPFSGHMLYQCPACEIVLLVDPMAVLSDNAAPLFPRRMPQQNRERVYQMAPAP